MFSADAHRRTENAPPCLVHRPLLSPSSAPSAPQPSPQSVSDSDGDLDLHRSPLGAARPRRWLTGYAGRPPRRRRSSTALAPSTTSGWRWKSGAEATKSGDREHPLHPVERAELRLQHGQRIECADRRGVGALLHGHRVAEGSDTGQLAVDPGELARGPGHPAVHDDRVERVMRWVRTMQPEAELLDPGTDAPPGDPGDPVDVSARSVRSRGGFWTSSPGHVRPPLERYSHGGIGDATSRDRPGATRLTTEMLSPASGGGRATYESEPRLRHRLTHGTRQRFA